MRHVLSVICVMLGLAFSTPLLGLSAEPGKKDLAVSLMRRGSGFTVVRFINRGNAPLTVFRPLDGSTSGWHWPHYRFDVTSEDGTHLPLPPRCGISGLWADTTWPEDYAVVLKPGEAFELPVRIPQIRDAGKYRVRFTYEIRDTPGKKTLGLERPDGTWFGSVSTDETVIGGG